MNENVDGESENFSNSKSSAAGCCLTFGYFFANFILVLLIKVLLIKKACSFHRMVPSWFLSRLGFHTNTHWSHGTRSFSMVSIVSSPKISIRLRHALLFLLFHHQFWFWLFHLLCKNHQLYLFFIMRCILELVSCI